MNLFQKSFAIIFFLFLTQFCFGQKVDSTKQEIKNDFQIFLKQPAKEIKLLMYEKNFLPVHGRLSEDHKSIIMKDYEPGTKVHVKVIYDDGMIDEFIKSPCFIDPVILLP
jgi:hypothetical protein